MKRKIIRWTLNLVGFTVLLAAALMMCAFKGEYIDCSGNTYEYEFGIGDYDYYYEENTVVVYPETTTTATATSEAVTTTTTEPSPEGETTTTTTPINTTTTTTTTTTTPINTTTTTTTTIPTTTTTTTTDTIRSLDIYVPVNTEVVIPFIGEAGITYSDGVAGSITANTLPAGLTLSETESAVSDDQTSLTAKADLTVSATETEGTLDSFVLRFSYSSATICEVDVTIHICDHERCTDGICDTCGEAYNGIGENLAGYSLSLEGNIGVNFYMELEDSVLSDENAYMQFTLGGKELSQVKVSEAVVDTTLVEGKTYHVFKCGVPAKNMDTAITAQMILSNGTTGKIYEYTVREYADYILAETSGYDETTKNLVQAMLNYGDYAEAYFNDTELAATAEMDAVTADTLAEYACSVTDENSLYYGSSLLLKSNTIVRHYFTNEFEGAAQKGDLWYIETEAIAAHNLGKAVTTEADGVTISYSPLSYTYKALSSETTSDSLKNLVKAMYLYYQAATAYAV